MCREKWIEICESYSIDVEKDPIPNKIHKEKRILFMSKKRKFQRDRLKTLKEERLSEKEKGLNKDIQSV